MTINALDHYNIQTARLDETVEFYVDVLGFAKGYRPGVRGTGAWLYAGGRPCVHINVIDDDMTGPTGPINHVAFETANEPGDYEAMQQRLTERGLPCRGERQQAQHPAPADLPARSQRHPPRTELPRRPAGSRVGGQLRRFERHPADVP